MSSIIPRNSHTVHCLFQENGNIVDASLKDIYSRYGIDGIIRIHEKDYGEFPAGNLFTHFNLQISHHMPGHIYALPKIIKPGFFIDQDHEQLPVLDFSGCFIARCLSVKEKVMYKDLTPEYFRYSFKNIQNTNDLKKEILWRYLQSLPRQSETEILSLGVSITHLEIINPAPSPHGIKPCGKDLCFHSFPWQDHGVFWKVLDKNNGLSMHTIVRYRLLTCAIK